MAYADKVKTDIAHWSREGLIGPDVAAALSRDIETRYRGGIGFGQVLAIMAGLLFAAAVLLVVAANWEAIPRIGRVGTLFALIAAGYVGGAALKLRGSDGFAEAAWLVSAAAFGASIALISQMYHISGDEKQAILIWCLGVAVAAAALRSNVLTAAAVALAAAWAVDFDFDLSVDHWLPVLLAALWAVAVWTRSVPARHLIVLALIGHVLLNFAEYGHVAIPVGLVIVCAGLVYAVATRPDLVERLTGLGSGLATDGMIGFLGGIFALQIMFLDEAHFAWLAAIAFAGIAGALVFAGHVGRGVRWIAYLGFALEIVMVFWSTIGTMLGTAGFFLLGSLGLGLLAFIIIRIERRLAASAAQTGAAS